MKKSILLFAGILMTISALGYMNWQQSKNTHQDNNCSQPTERTDDPPPLFIPKAVNLYYDLGTRFGAIKKSELLKATSIRDFFTDHVNEEIFSIESASIIVIKNDQHTNIQQANRGNKLNAAQLKLLRNCDYSTCLKISTDVKTESGYGYYSPHITVVPEQQARYSLGKKAFLQYLENGNKKHAYNLNLNKLGFAKLYFTVSAKGELTKIKLDRSSGYDFLDKEMIDLLKNAPGKWQAAKTQAGELVDQELVISFGKEGC